MLENEKQAEAHIYEPANLEYPYQNLHKARKVIEWLVEEYQTEYDLLKANNKFYNEIRSNLKQNDRNHYCEIWEELNYLYSPRLQEAKYQKLLKTRSGLINVTGAPIKFCEKLQTLENKKERVDTWKGRKLINIEQQQYLTKIPFYKAKEHLAPELSSNLNINIFDLQYEKERGILYESQPRII